MQLRILAAAIAVVVSMLTPGAPALASPLSQHSNVAKTEMKRGNYVAAVIAMEADIAAGTDRPKVLKLFLKDKAFKSGLLTQVSTPSSTETITFEDAARATLLAQQTGLLSPDEGVAALGSLREAFATGVVAGSIRADIRASETLLSALDRPDVNLALVANTLRRLGGHKVTNPEFAALVGFARTRANPAALSKAVSVSLPSLTYRRKALLESVADFDKAFAAKRLAETTTKVFFDIQSTDGLVALDLKAALAQNENFEIMYDAGQADVVIDLKQLALAVEKLDENTRTVSYQQYQVNFVAAILLMPDNATYQFEYSEGGYQYEFAFSLKLVRKGAVGGETLIRDSGRLVWTACKNQRIVNVFGGTQPASFMANAEMQNTCAKARPRVDQTEIRNWIVRKLVSAIDNGQIHK